jgi:hypothetical protein
MIKLKITRPDGTIVEVEASAADINTIALSLGLTWINWQGGVQQFQPFYAPEPFKIKY